MKRLFILIVLLAFAANAQEKVMLTDSYGVTYPYIVNTKHVKLHTNDQNQTKEYLVAYAVDAEYRRLRKVKDGYHKALINVFAYLDENEIEVIEN